MRARVTADDIFTERVVIRDGFTSEELQLSSVLYARLVQRGTAKYWGDFTLGALSTDVVH